MPVPMQTPALRPRAGTYAGVFMVTLATLMYEIGLTRIFSVTMWYHFAFVAISVALFGMTLGALTVHLLPKRFPDERVRENMWLFTLLFAVSLAVCFVIQLNIPFTPRLTPGGIASVVSTCLVISIPFVFSGVVVCLALTRFPARVNRLYAVDLVGAGLGCVLLVVLFSFIDGPSLIIIVGALAALAALVFALDARSRKGMAAAALAFAVLGGTGAVNAFLHADGRPFLDIVWAKENRDPDHAYERWNAFSRLTVGGDRERDNSVGMLIDSTAGTGLFRYTGDESESDFLRPDISNIAHHVRDDADVLVIGVGGGRDILSALEFEQRSVTGVEINADILDITNNVYGDFTGHLDRDPRVDFVNAEARSYLTRTERKYDIIQISLIDTWAASSSGAFALSENSLYTTEAWDVFFERLNPGGILSVSRWYNTVGQDEPLESFRTTALASEALTQHGVENPRDNMISYHGPPGFFGVNVATVLVSPDAFSAEDRRVLDERAQEYDFTPVLTANAAADPRFELLASPGGPGPGLKEFTEDVSAPTDDQPFFFQMADLDTVFSKRLLEDNIVTRPVLVLSLLAVTVLALASCCIALPLFAARRESGRGPVQKGGLPYYTYFAGIGLGFLLIEISQLQRLSIYLGHPTYGLTVVLFSVLIFSGIGSMLTERFVRTDRAGSLIAPLLVLLGVVALYGLIAPGVIDATDGSTTPARIAIAVAMLAPLGLLMGMPFSVGMRAASRRPGTPTAYLWGINGATSVCASVFGVVIALFFGIPAAFLAGAAAYVLALVSMIFIVRSEPEAEPATVAADDQADLVTNPVPVGS